jgi:hypothetical protein
MCRTLNSIDIPDNTEVEESAFRLSALSD